ncbi:MAG: hypothetical protein J6T55_04115 [Alphaproteobacteria bacterium]|nr:hypothetical protein [Alphaproteobacteria bacterium]
MNRFTRVFFLILILGSVCALAGTKSQTAFSQNRGCKNPTITVKLKKETPTYENKPYSELKQLCHPDEYSVVLGCTTCAYACKQKIFLNEKGCKQLDLECYPTNFHVYIDKVYPKKSCEYEAVKKHENFHVSAIQNFPTKSIENYLMNCINKEIQKKVIKEGEKIYSKCASQAITWMNLKREEKNTEIDSYKKYDPFFFSKCKNWQFDQESIEGHLDHLLD